MQPNPGPRPLLPGPDSPATLWRGRSYLCHVPPPHRPTTPSSPASPLGLRCPRPPRVCPYPAPLSSQDGQCRPALGHAQPLPPGPSLIRREPPVIIPQPVGQRCLPSPVCAPDPAGGHFLLSGSGRCCPALPREGTEAAQGRTAGWGLSRSLPCSGPQFLLLKRHLWGAAEAGHQAG